MIMMGMRLKLTKINNMESDQIDSMDAEELRVEIRRMLGWADNWKKCATAWRETDRLRQHDMPELAERARIRAQMAEECAANILQNVEAKSSGLTNVTIET